MFWFLLAIHVLAAVTAALIARRSAIAATVVAAAAPAFAGVWGLVALVSPSQSAPSSSHQWVEGLGLEFAFRLTPFSALLTAAVGLIGMLIVVYAHGYFGGVQPRFITTLLAFAGSMLGLVWADSIWTLFIFWEATSVTSFLLVGHKHTSEAARTAARRALVITAAGGLVLLAGFLVLASATGTTVLSQMSAVTGTQASVAGLLIVVAAATKSALVPFHVWLPGAMAAPTPVSAYLHSATMVKAGVVLIAVAEPVVAGNASFRVTALVLGSLTMFWGAIGALRQRDAKLILAWGTVSQLGLLVVLFATGTGKAIFAGVAMLAAHAVFKAALFMIIGEVDVRTGTRDIDKLDGLHRSMRPSMVVAVAAGLSMAGVPPMVGFPSKEAAIEAMLGLAGAERWLIGGAVIGAAVLTVAYTVHLLYGVFGPGRSDRVAGPTEVASWRPAMLVPAASLACASLLGWLFSGPVGDRIANAAETLDDKAKVYTLIAWPGATTAFFVSLAIVVVGATVGWVRAQRGGRIPDTTGANVADWLIGGIAIPARITTSRIQHGSLPVYLATMATVVSLTTIPFAVAVFQLDLDVVVGDSPAQIGLAIAVVITAWGATMVDSRIGAALALGVVGLAVTGLFVAHGAPDLVLTQLLVETVIVVGFVVGLGRLRRSFPPSSGAWRLIRIGVAGLSALAVAVGMLAVSSARPALPTADLVDQAVEVGGGNNVVNVVLTDSRALDTLGEIVVLAVVAIGVLALVGHRTSREGAAA